MLFRQTGQANNVCFRQGANLVLKMDSASHTAPGRLATILLLVVPVVLLHFFVVPGLYDPGLHAKYFFLTIYLVVLGAFAFFGRGKNVEPAAAINLPGLPIWWIGLALPGVLSFSLLWANTSLEGLPTVARWWEVFGLMSLLVTVFAGSGKVQFQRWLPRLATVFVLVAAWWALVELVWVVRGQGYSHGSTYWVLASFAHRNLLSHAVLLAMPLALLVFLRDRGVWCWLAGLALGLGAAVTLLLLVRTSWLAMALAGLALGLCWWPVRSRLAPEPRRIAGRRLARMVGIVVVVSTCGLIAYRPALSEKKLFQKHLAGFAGGSYGSQGERILYWKRSLELAREKPFAGHGAGSWKIEAPGYWIGYSNKAVGKAQKYVVRAHNDYLQLWNEGGIFALLAFLLFGGMLGGKALRQMRKSDGNTIDPSPTRLRSDHPPPPLDLTSLNALCYALGLLIYGVISGFSFPMERASSYVWLALYAAAILLNGSLPQRTPGRPRNELLRALLPMVLAVLLAVLGGLWIKADLQTRKALRAFETGKNTEAICLLDDHLLWFTPLDPASTPLAWHRGMARLEMKDAAGATWDFEMAFRNNPRHPHVLNNLAALLTQQGEFDRPREMLRVAVLVAPGLDDARLNLAGLEYNAGRMDSAWYHMGRIPFTCPDYKYLPLRSAILSAMAQKSALRYVNTPLEPVVNAFARNEKLQTRLHKGAIRLKRSFDEQVLIAALYVLHKHQKAINFAEAKDLFLRLYRKEP